MDAIANGAGGAQGSIDVFARGVVATIRRTRAAVADHPSVFGKGDSDGIGAVESIDFGSHRGVAVIVNMDAPIQKKSVAAVYGCVREFSLVFIFQ